MNETKFINNIIEERLELEALTYDAIEKLEADISDFAKTIEVITYVPESKLKKDIKKVL